jgi:hypothetical protein
VPTAMGAWQITVSCRDGAKARLQYERGTAPPSPGETISLPDPREAGKDIRLQIVGGVAYSPPHKYDVGVWEFEAIEV